MSIKSFIIHRETCPSNCSSVNTRSKTEMNPSVHEKLSQIFGVKNVPWIYMFVVASVVVLNNEDAHVSRTKFLTYSEMA